MITEVHNAPRRESGFSLIEVLVSTVVFSIGVLGVAGLGAVSKRATFESVQRGQASELAYALLEEMRANKAGIAVYLAAGTLGHGSLGAEPAPDCDAAGALCTAAQFATHSLWAWERMLDTGPRKLGRREHGRLGRAERVHRRVPRAAARAITSSPSCGAVSPSSPTPVSLRAAPAAAYTALATTCAAWSSCKVSSTPRSKVVIAMDWRFANASKGFTIIELMVAMLLGLLLGIAIVTVFVQNRHGFDRDESIVRMQDDARQTVRELTNDLSMAGFLADLILPGAVTEDGSLAVATDCGPAGVPNWIFHTVTPGTNDSQVLTGVDNATGATANAAFSCIAAAEIVPGTDVIAVKRMAGARLVGAAVANTVYLRTNGHAGAALPRARRCTAGDHGARAVFRMGVSPEHLLRSQFRNGGRRRDTDTVPESAAVRRRYDDGHRVCGPRHREPAGRVRS